MLDRFPRVLYIAAVLVTVACPSGPAPLVPAALAPADAQVALEWARATLPRRQVAVQFRWRYRDERAGWAGRGVARIAPPDSLRFDFRGPFGYTAAAAIVGDSLLWTEPQGEFGALAGGIPLLWAAFGAVQPPPLDARVYGLADAPRTLWRFVVGSIDTLDYVSSERTPRLLEAEWRQGGHVRARSRTEWGQDGAPASARIDFPEVSARFELTVLGRDTAAAFAAALWRAR